MSRPASIDKFRALVESAIGQFIAHGYQRTQVAEIAAQMGIANGTVYGYVESKEALFDLAARYADTPLPSQLPAALPVPTPAGGATLEFVTRALAARAVFPQLMAALERAEPADVKTEAEGIAREVYDVLARNRRGLKLIDRCAADYPELGAVWFYAGRGGLTARLESYLAHRSRWLRPIPNPGITARLMLEVLVLWAVHRHFDPHPQPMDEAAARAEAVEWVWRSLVRSR
jgi:AcrR family transcriptional regulator